MNFSCEIYLDNRVTSSMDWWCLYAYILLLDTTEYLIYIASWYHRVFVANFSWIIFPIYSSFSKSKLFWISFSCLLLNTNCISYSQLICSVGFFWGKTLDLHVYGALRDLVPFVQFKKRKKHPWRSVTFTVCNFNKSNTPPWVFVTFFKLYKWY